MKIGLWPLLFATLLLSGCSTLKRWFTYDPNEVLYANGYSKTTQDDFSDQLIDLGRVLLKSKGVKTKKLSAKNQKYLENMYTRMINANELFFDEAYKPQFIVIRDKRPFFFSLPEGRFYFSSSLLKNYMKFEGILTAIMATQILKSHKLLYKRIRFYPLGHVSIERMLSIVRLPFHEKNEINKWAYLLIRRSGYNYHAYLSWMQTLNKNAIDFSLQLGGGSFVSREEFMFKKFLIDKGWNIPNMDLVKNSSKGFYAFQREVRSLF